MADARKTERFDVAEALETRNNRLAQAWADRETTKAEGRLQTARSGAYSDVLATLAGTRKQPLPRLPDCSPAAPGVTAAGDQDAACLPSFSPVNLDAILADDYAMPGWTYHRLWDDVTATAPLSWVPPVQLAENQVHPVPPPLPGSFIFSGSSPPPPPTDLSASLASSAFPEYYNNVIDLIFGNWDFDRTRHLRGFRPVGTGVDAVFRAYASPPTESFDHLTSAPGPNGGTGSTASGGSSLDDGYDRSPTTASPTAGGTYGSTNESGGWLGGYGYSPTGTGGTTLAPENGALSAGSYGYNGSSSLAGSPSRGPYGNESSDPSSPPSTEGDGTPGGLAGDDSVGGIRGASSGKSRAEPLPTMRAGVRPQTVSGYSAPRPIPFPLPGESDQSVRPLHLPLTSQFDTLYHRYLSRDTDAPLAEQTLAPNHEKVEGEVVVIVVVIAGDNSDVSSQPVFDLSKVRDSQFWKEWTAQELLALGRSIGAGVELINTYGFAPEQLALIRQGRSPLRHRPTIRDTGTSLGYIIRSACPATTAPTQRRF